MGMYMACRRLLYVQQNITIVIFPSSAQLRVCQRYGRYITTAGRYTRCQAPTQICKLFTSAAASQQCYHLIPASSRFTLFLISHRYSLVLHHYRTYHPHCNPIHTQLAVLTTTGPANPAPHFDVPKTRHSLTKCTNAIPYVHSASWYIGPFVMLYAA